MNQINLLPEDIVKERLRKSVDLTLVILFTVVMISVILAERISSRNFDVITQEHTLEDGKFAQVNSSSTEFFSLMSKQSTHVADVKKSLDLEQKVPRSYALAIITNACPDELSLEKVNFSVNEKIKEQRNGKVVMTNFSSDAPVNPHENEEDLIDIYGVAATDGDVTDFVSRLRSNPVFKDVNLIQTKEWSSMKARKTEKDEKLFEPSREFSVSMKVNRDVDLQKLVKITGKKSPKTAETAGGEK